MASIKTYAELKAYFETGDKPTQSQFEDLLYTMFNGLSQKPKVYRALLTEVDGEAPTAVVLENTTGETPTFSYVSSGQYLLTFAQTLDANKTFVTNGQPGLVGSTIVFRAFYNSANTIKLQTTAVDTPENTDDGLLNTAIEILIYP